MKEEIRSWEIFLLFPFLNDDEKIKMAERKICMKILSRWWKISTPNMKIFLINLISISLIFFKLSNSSHKINFHFLHIRFPFKKMTEREFWTSFQKCGFPAFCCQRQLRTRETKNALIKNSWVDKQTFLILIRFCVCVCVYVVILKIKRKYKEEHCFRKKLLKI